jgi:hypothetical protein
MSLTRINLALIAGLLLGYMFLDRGFAYVGYTPIFVGELVLVFTLLVALLTGFSGRLLTTPIGILLLAFLFWSAGVLMFNTTGRWIDALRDSVIWGYGLYAILVGSLLLRTRSIEISLHTYTRFIPWFAAWSAPAYVLTFELTMANVLPNFPGTDVPILSVKAGDIAVHLAGALAFLVLGLHRDFPYQSKQWSWFKEMACYGGTFLGVIATGSRNRGGLVSVLLALAVVMLFRPNNRLTRFILPVLIVAPLLSLFDVSIPVGGQREISLNQIFANVQSIVGDSDKEILTGTVEWRLQWWDAIIKETVYGERFWHGSGFGNSLAQDHGFRDDTGNRSPHNGHLTILARTGVPGIILWAVLIGTIYTMLAWSYLNGVRNNQVRVAKVNLWIMAYLTAMLLNMSFDVYLEGPQGGIWFWCLVGFAMALVYTQRVNAAARARVGIGRGSGRGVGARTVGATPSRPGMHRRG